MDVEVLASAVEPRPLPAEPAAHGPVIARNLFGIRFQLATDAEQRYLAAMASLGDPPTARRWPAPSAAKDQRGVFVHWEALIGEGLISSPRRGQLDFTVPLFAEFLRDNHPIASFGDN